MTQDHYDAITIGSGLGSLAFAARLAAAGKRVLVLERLANLGGAATVYRYNDLTIEASLHEIDGATLHGADSVFARLGIEGAVDVLPTEEFYAVRGGALPEELIVPHGLGAAEAALTQAFPEARHGIGTLFAELRALHTTLAHLESARDGELRTLVGDIVSGRMIALMRAAGRTVEQGLGRHLAGHDAAQLAIGAPIAYFDDDPASLSWLLYGGIWARYVENGSFYFRGGSQALTMALARLITARGGHIARQAEVTAVTVDEAGAAGVTYRDATGTENAVTAMVTAAGMAPSSLAGMIEDPVMREAVRAPYASFSPSVSLFTVALGLDRPAASFGVNAYSTFVYPDDLVLLRDYPEAALRFSVDPPRRMPPYVLCDYGRLGTALGQEGEPHSVSLTGVDRLHWWEAEDEASEMARRGRWMDALIADVDRHFPGFAAAVVRRRMAVARTMKNRLGTPEGEVYGFRPTPRRLFSRRPHAETPVPGLYLSSAYTLSGGYAGALNGGLMAAEAALASGRMGLARG